jgi:hypothetical protein
MVVGVRAPGAVECRADKVRAYLRGLAVVVRGDCPTACSTTPTCSTSVISSSAIVPSAIVPQAVIAIVPTAHPNTADSMFPSVSRCSAFIPPGE